MVCSGVNDLYSKNPEKDRYRDVLPFEHNRVILAERQLNGTGNDERDSYINASRIGGTRFIATQAPLEETVADFFDMCRQEDVKLIVTIGNIQESDGNGGFREKMFRYWPKLKESQCEIVSGDKLKQRRLRVTLREQIEHEDSLSIIRKLEIEDLTPCGEGENPIPRLSITQLHFTDWPDHGVPNDSEPLISAVQLSANLASGCTTAIHCSAGVGRTGVFVAVDCLLSLRSVGVEITPGVVYRTVAHLKRQRRLTVQNFLQYKFILTCLNLR